MHSFFGRDGGTSLWRWSLKFPLVLGLCALIWGGSQPAWADDAADPAQSPSTEGAPAAPVLTDENDQTPADEEVAMEANVVGWLELSESLREGPMPFAWVSREEVAPSLSDVLSQLETVAKGEQYLGLVIYLDRPELALSEVNAIMQGIQQIRKQGKRVLVFSDAYSMRDYMLASAADLILLQHKGQLGLHGISVEEMYVAGLLEKIGVQADFVQIGKYKGADEQLMRNGPSEAWNENMDGLLDNLYSQIVEPIAKNRQMSVEEFEGLMAKSWAMSDLEYMRNHLVDRLVSRDLLDVTEVEFGDDFIWDDAMGISSQSGMNTQSPLAMFSMLFQKPQMQATRPTVAVLHARGMIHSGYSTRGAGAFSDDSIGSRTMVRLLGELRDEENIKAVVLRLNSPGGSALASEVIWQAVRQLGEQKPVFVSIGNLAASGGYYIACGGEQIYVSPQSILGSIGVVGGKLALGGLYEWAGVNVYRRDRGPLADMFNSVDTFTPQQRQLIKKSMEQVYDQFTDRVKIGRGNRIKDIDKVAAGRLFTGSQCVKNGLADKIGNLEQTITAAASAANLPKGTYEVMHWPGPMSLQEFISDLFQAGGAPAPKLVAPGKDQAMLETFKQIIGPERWAQIRSRLAGLMLLQREPVLAIMPTMLVIH